MANVLKGDRYKIAFERIKRAIANGYPFEAVTLCESIIADRLLSNAKGRGVRFNKKTSLQTLLDNAAAKGGLAKELSGQLDAWIDERNSVIHEFVKTEPGESPNQSAEEALKDVERAAREGKKLAREVCKWHRDELNKAKRERR